MTTEAIGWSKAPEDATHFNTTNECWYRTSSAEYADIMRSSGEWEESLFTVEEIERSVNFFPNPVSSEQIVPAEVETAVSTEAHSIEPKPPLGLTPKNIWEEQMQHQRRQDIHAAMQRYIEAGKEIPNDWLHELLELNNAIGNVKVQEVLATVKQNIKEEIDVEQPDNSDEGWIEWGRKTTPDIPNNTTVEKVYSDGDVTVGRNGDSFWYGQAGLDDKSYVVTRYRIINEETE